MQLPLRLLLIALLIAVGVSQGVEQATEGKYKTPGLVSDLSKLALGGAVSASGLTAIERITAQTRRSRKKVSKKGEKRRE